MNKICVVARNFETYFVKRLMSEVGKGSLVFFNPWEEHVLPTADLYLARSTAIYGNDQDLVRLRTLPDSKRIINSVEVLERFRTKPLQYQWFAEQAMPRLAWQSLQGKEIKDIPGLFEKLNITFAVVKPHRGQGGWGVKKLTLDECVEWWQERKAAQDEEYLLQPYVEGDEYRVFFIKNRKWILKRTGQGIAANFSAGGEAQLSPLSGKADSIITELIRKSAAHYGAIDFFQSGDDLWLLELNTCPGVEQLEQVTQHNIIAELIKSF